MMSQDIAWLAYKGEVIPASASEQTTTACKQKRVVGCKNIQMSGRELILHAKTRQTLTIHTLEWSWGRIQSKDAASTT
jgi:hypothetical protein